MKPEEELNALKEEVKILKVKLSALTEEELEQVTGGTASTPGVQITQPSAQPGKGFKVNINGIGTIGSDDPLYVADGEAGAPLNINPKDIETMDILKDAATAAIYGARAAN